MDLRNNCNVRKMMLSVLSEHMHPRHFQRPPR